MVYTWYVIVVTHRAESPVSRQCMAAHAQSAFQKTAAAFTSSSPCAASSVLCDRLYASAGSVHFFTFTGSDFLGKPR
jgi:hypothetical protein